MNSSNLWQKKTRHGFLSLAVTTCNLLQRQKNGPVLKASTEPGGKRNLDFFYFVGGWLNFASTSFTASL